MLMPVADKPFLRSLARRWKPRHAANRMARSLL